MNVQELEAKANQIRRKTLDMIYYAQKGHIGGALSMTDILVELFYDGILKFDKNNPKWENRDRFFLSKGHAVASLYIILNNLGIAREEDFYQNGNLLGYPMTTVPGIEVCTGSLGHGLAIGAGTALAARMDSKDFLTFVLLGDGECYEGSVWETAMFAAHHNLNNLVAIIDRNYQITLDYTETVLKLESLEEKWKSFGWNTISVDGHSFNELKRAFWNIRNKSRPTVIIAHTVKGKGISFMEGECKWHHGVPNKTEYEAGKLELEERN